MDLLLGCGRSRVKKLWLGEQSNWNELVTLDYNSDVKPDVVHDLTKHPLPFKDNFFLVYICLMFSNIWPIKVITNISLESLLNTIDC